MRQHLPQNEAKIGHMHMPGTVSKWALCKLLRVCAYCKHMTEDVKQSLPKESHQLTDVYFGPEKGGGEGEG
jgi:hypothetical protein